MLHEHIGDFFLGDWRSADLLAFCLGVLHPALDPCADHRQFQLTEHTSHLQEGFAHGIGLTLPAVKRDAPHDHKPQLLLAHLVDDLTELLRASRQARNFKRDDRVALLGLFRLADGRRDTENYANEAHQASA